MTIARRSLVVLAALVPGVVLPPGVPAALGQTVVQPAVPRPTADKPAYPASPFHGVLDGNGQVIPCRCRFQGREFRLGEEVCMSTHAGTVLARCDLDQNNTSWVPTETPCTISLGPPAAPAPAPGGRLAEALVERAP